MYCCEDYGLSSIMSKLELSFYVLLLYVHVYPVTPVLEAPHPRRKPKQGLYIYTYIHNIYTTPGSIYYRAYTGPKSLNHSYALVHNRSNHPHLSIPGPYPCRSVTQPPPPQISADRVAEPYPRRSNFHRHPSPPGFQRRPRIHLTQCSGDPACSGDAPTPPRHMTSRYSADAPAVTWSPDPHH
jgi:hypothetical protein